ncbi:copia-type polyprotein, partial [Trifolium pratense]
MYLMFTGKKLDPKSIKCIHLGVSEESKAYKLYDPIQKKIIISRDVVFDEKQGWKWNEKGDKKEIQLIDDNVDGSVQVEPVAEDPVTTEPAVQSDSDMDTTSEEDDDNIENALGQRARKPPGWMRDYVTGSELQEEEQLQNLAVFCNSEDPTCFEEAVKLAVWREAMDQEIESIERNGTWELTDLPQGMKKIGVKWVYKTKYNEQVFAPVARWDTIRTILALAASHGYNKQEGKVYKLKKALYGLKQAPRAWYSKIESYFAQEKFQKCPHEHTLFIKKDSKKNILIVSLYVDDLIFTGSNEDMFEEFKTSMKSKFSMTDLGKMRFFLGVEVKQFNEGIFICQQKYAKELLLRFKMDQCNKVCSPMVPGNKLIRDENGKLIDATNYRQMTGCLMYLLATRPDLTFS